MPYHCSIFAIIIIVNIGLISIFAVSVVSCPFMHLHRILLINQTRFIIRISIFVHLSIVFITISSMSLLMLFVLGYIAIFNCRCISVLQLRLHVQVLPRGAASVSYSSSISAYASSYSSHFLHTHMHWHRRSHLGHLRTTSPNSKAT